MSQLDISRGQLTARIHGVRRVAGDLTVIIPTVGRPILHRCLRSIAIGTVAPARVVVVDQGENPEVMAWLGELDTVGIETLHVPSSERSAASARNRGLELVTTQFVAAIDDDCVAATDWIETMEMCLHQNPDALVTGRLEAEGDDIPPTVVTSTVPCVHTRPSVRILSPLHSANMGFALGTARRIGPFDAKLIEAEENDWAYRALRTAIPIVYAPQLRVEHVHWRDERQLTSVYRAYAGSQGAFYGKHLRRGDWSMAARIGLTLLRGARDFVWGFARRDATQRAKGYARLIRLIPGVYSGLRGRGSP